MGIKFISSHKAILRIISSIILLSLITILFIVIGKHNSTANDDGAIIVLINNKDDNIESYKKINYKKNDTLFDLINDNYNLNYDLTVYGHYLKGISNDDFSIETDGSSSWLWFELFYLKDGKSYEEVIDFNNYDEISISSGIDGIELKNNMIFAINERDSLHNSSVLNNSNIKIENDENTILYISFIAILIIIILAIIVLFLIDLIKSIKITPINIKDISIMVFLTALLFVQEELLSFIPNVQFTFILIMLYGAVLGPKKASLIVLVHVLLDNLFMSSFIPTVILPMLIGHEINMLIGYFLKGKNTIILSIGITISSIIYSFLFFISTIFIFKIDPIAYLLADIPFDIILILCNILCVILLYDPLYKVLNNNINPM